MFEFCTSSLELGREIKKALLKWQKAENSANAYVPSENKNPFEADSVQMKVKPGLETEAQSSGLDTFSNKTKK